MKTWANIVSAVIVVMLLAATLGAGIDQAKPNQLPANGADPHAGLGIPPVAASAPSAAEGAARADFAQNINLDAFRRLAVQHRDIVKTLDSWARQSLLTIRNRQSIDGQDALYVALDMALRPTAWVDRNIFYIQAVPIREQFMRLAVGDTDAARRTEAERILREGLVSYNFLTRPEVQETLEVIGQDARRSAAVAKVQFARYTFERLLPSLAIVPPSSAEDAAAAPWHNPYELFANFPDAAAQYEKMHVPSQPPVPGFSAAEAQRIVLAAEQLRTGWEEADWQLANRGMSALSAALPSVNSGTYPGSAKRETEVWYNRTFNGTIVAFIYFLAMVLFVMVAVGVTGKLEKWALSAYGLALAAHIAAMGVRWWLAGRIPIQNQFESVLGSALIGCIVGLALESWKRKGIFGMAFSFVGFLAMTACLAAPYVFGTDLGGSISRVAGILDTFWLYIHVNIVIASYALIFASCVIGLAYLGIRLWHWINPVGLSFTDPLPTPTDALRDAEITKTPRGTRVLVTLPPLSEKAARAVQERNAILTRRTAALEPLDQANMVVLQMAFWLLGVGIMCGAVWADKSWGRPWGWDPKETFALVTWIVYLIIVHLRFVTRARADLTATLSVVGCVVMLFNWIGVNFFLAGLHSYA